MDTNCPKTLIIEHPPIHREGIGKTLYSFFALWPKSHLYQVYTVRLPLDIALCNYFFLDEWGMGRDCIITNYSTAEKIGDNDINKEMNENSFSVTKMVQRWVKHFAHTSLGIQCRNYIFSKNKKRHKGLMEWIDSISPECIFYGIGELVSESEYVLEIARAKQIPLIIYISDDYLAKWYEGHDSSSYAKKIKDTYDKLLKFSDMIVVISEKMLEKYKQLYPNSSYFIAQNSALKKEHVLKKKVRNSGKTIIRLIYTGNIGLGRFNTLEKIGRSLQFINNNSDKYKVVLDVYTPTLPDGKIIDSLKRAGINYRGNATGDELDKVRFESDTLLMVESFDRIYKEILATALTTKTAEYLSYHRNILVVAPEYASSADYLKKNNAAVVINEINNLKGSLQKYIENLIDGKLQDKLDSAEHLFETRHEFWTNASMFQEKIMEVVENYHESSAD